MAELWDTARTPRPRSRPMAPHGAWHRGTGEPRRLPGVAKSAIEIGDLPRFTHEKWWFSMISHSWCMSVYQRVKADLSGTYWHTWHWLVESIWVTGCVPKWFFVRQMIRRGGFKPDDQPTMTILRIRPRNIWTNFGYVWPDGFPSQHGRMNVLKMKTVWFCGSWANHFWAGKSLMHRTQ